MSTSTGIPAGTWNWAGRFSGFRNQSKTPDICRFLSTGRTSVGEPRPLHRRNQGLDIVEPVFPGPLVQPDCEKPGKSRRLQHLEGLLHEKDEQSDHFLPHEVEGCRILLGSPGLSQIELEDQCRDSEEVGQVAVELPKDDGLDRNHERLAVLVVRLEALPESSGLAHPLEVPEDLRHVDIPRQLRGHVTYRRERPYSLP